MSWEAARTLEFDEWWEMLTDSEQRRVVASVEALEELGPTAGRFYKQMVRRADRIYKEHLESGAPGHTKEIPSDGGNEEIQGTQRGGP